jgi:carboxyl-terminal processing protease
MNKRVKLIVVSLSSLLLAVLLLGAVLGKSSAADGDAYRHFAVLTDVISRIKSDYVEEPDMKNVTLGALNGMLENVDPYASYLSADQYKQYVKTRESKKAHVGLLLARRFGYVSVIDAIPGSPAAKQGLSTGDVLETINGVGTRDMPLAFAEMLLYGEPGTTVELAVLRVRRGTDAQKIALVRAPITPPAPVARTADGVGILEVRALPPGAARDVAAKLAEFQQQGVKKLVLDLRHCAFGDAAEGIALANLFLGNGSLGYLVGQKVPRKDFAADPAKLVWKEPLVVITNRGTAGGAEIAAAALLDAKRAEVVGERTYGDAAERKALTLDDGSAVILSVAKYYSPSGKAIQDNAVTPSLAVADGEPESDDDDDAAPAAEPSKKPAEDMPLKKAIEVLNVGLAAARQSTGATAQAAGGVASAPATTPLGVPRPPR